MALLAVGAAGAVPACTAADPQLPPDPNPIVTSSAEPPPISGGTLLLTKAGLVVAADSDRDAVYVVDLGTKAVSTIALQKGDEPGRVIEGDQGRLHVALRGAGAVATIDLALKQVTSRTPVCSAPRGLAYDATSAVVHVACAGGELVTLPEAGGAPVRALRLADRDLRDVIVQGDELLVTRFKSVDMLVLDAQGTVIARDTAPGIDDPSIVGSTFSPTVAWRAIPAPSGGAFVVHQLAAVSPVVISQPGGYNGGGGGPDPMCPGTIVQTTVTRFNANGAAVSAPNLVAGATVPVDLASDGVGNLALISAGSDALFMIQELDLGSQPGCMIPGQVALPGQPVGVVSTPTGFVVQLREMTPGKGQGPALVVSDGSQVTATIPLPGASMANTGHSLFHHNASSTSALACASCHPEGHEDGHVWLFDTLGSRRTQTVSGRVLETAPLHWNGDMSDLTDIMHEVFEKRMSGNPAEAGPRHVTALGEWLNSIPAHPASPTGTEAQIEHGKQLFYSATTGCTTCHNGPHLTNNQTVDVGTGQPFQVPSLIGVAARAPFMHDGCAATLADRFDPNQSSCNGGDKHGNTSQLSSADVSDLVAFLETL